jgi:hypothetical protein
MQYVANLPGDGPQQARPERRSGGLRCARCGSARCQLTAATGDIVLRCLQCSYAWSDRRTSARLGPHCAPASESMQSAVSAICRSTDTATVIANTLTWTQRLTEADWVSLRFGGRATRYGMERTGIVQETALDDTVARVLMPQQASLLSADTMEDTSELRDAGRVAIIPVLTPALASDAIAVLSAYWREESAATVWHLQTMQLLADTVASRIG